MTRIATDQRNRNPCDPWPISRPAQSDERSGSTGRQSHGPFAIPVSGSVASLGSSGASRLNGDRCRSRLRSSYRSGRRSAIRPALRRLSGPAAAPGCEPAVAGDFGNAIAGQRTTKPSDATSRRTLQGDHFGNVGAGRRSTKDAHAANRTTPQRQRLSLAPKNRPRARADGGEPAVLARQNRRWRDHGSKAKHRGEPIEQPTETFAAPDSQSRSHG